MSLVRRLKKTSSNVSALKQQNKKLIQQGAAKDLRIAELAAANELLLKERGELKEILDTIDGEDQSAFQEESPADIAEHQAEARAAANQKRYLRPHEYIQLAREKPADMNATAWALESDVDSWNMRRAVRVIKYEALAMLVENEQLSLEIACNTFLNGARSLPAEAIILAIRQCVKMDKKRYKRKDCEAAIDAAMAIYSGVNSRTSAASNLSSVEV